MFLDFSYKLDERQHKLAVTLGCIVRVSRGAGTYVYILSTSRAASILRILRCILSCADCLACCGVIIKIKIHSSCEIEYFVETHLCKLCVILRSRVLRVVCPHY